MHLSDSHYITDASKFISVSLLALRAMMALELPHVNVLSKIDLLASYGELSFDLRYYAECRDLDYLLDKLEHEPGVGRMKALNRAMVELVEEYGAVSFETLAVEVGPAQDLPHHRHLSNDRKKGACSSCCG